MFKRVLVEDWAQIIPIIAFFIFFIVFLAVTVRAMWMKESERDRLASMPLEDNSKTPNSDTP
jgi:hypothetical protein